MEDLLTERGNRETHAQYGKLPDRSLVYLIYEKYGPRSSVRFWSHAEEFLDFTDAALEAPDSTRRNLLDGFIRGTGHAEPPSVEQFRKLAILAVAAECSAFVDRGSVRSETWRPFVDWAGRLAERDTVITFNYDRVIERLGEADGVRLVGERSVIRPGETVKAGVCPVFKLHGSTTWGVDKTGGFSAFDTKQFMDGKLEFENLIATPGTTKLGHCEGLLKPLWEKAIDRLRAADVVVFLGYRFPPSDSHSRKTLLGAIRDSSRGYLRVHTVLGPDRPTDSARLATMLKSVLEGRGRSPRSRPDDYRNNQYNVVEQPLYAQDFLTIYTDRMLEGW